MNSARRIVASFLLALYGCSHAAAGNGPDGGGTDTATGGDPCAVEVEQPDSGLFWCRCQIGATWNGTSCEGGGGFDCQESLSACPPGYEIPTAQQFGALLGTCIYDEWSGLPEHCDPCSTSPVCSSMFGHEDDGEYWTSTGVPIEGGWFVVFFLTGNFHVFQSCEEDWASVRCVRSQ